jgi:hypothetical protein
VASLRLVLLLALIPFGTGCLCAGYRTGGAVQADTAGRFGTEGMAEGFMGVFFPKANAIESGLAVTTGIRNHSARASFGADDRLSFRTEVGDRNVVVGPYASVRALIGEHGVEPEGEAGVGIAVQPYLKKNDSRQLGLELRIGWTTARPEGGKGSTVDAGRLSLRMYFERFAAAEIGPPLPPIPQPKPR